MVEQVSKGVKRGSQEVTEVGKREGERGGGREGLGRGNNGLTKD